MLESTKFVLNIHDRSKQHGKQQQQQQQFLNRLKTLQLSLDLSPIKPITCLSERIKWANLGNDG